jgi:hypothetical protein
MFHDLKLKIKTVQILTFRRTLGVVITIEYDLYNVTVLRTDITPIVAHTTAFLSRREMNGIM